MRSLERLYQLVREDDRYPYEAYVFVFESLAHTQSRLGRGIALDPETRESLERHISGAELVEGMCDLAKQEFGMLAPLVFHNWGLHKTDDVGEAVFNLIEAELLSKTDSDSRDDFHDLFDLDDALRRDYSINLD